MGLGSYHVSDDYAPYLAKCNTLAHISQKRSVTLIAPSGIKYHVDPHSLRRFELLLVLKATKQSRFLRYCPIDKKVSPVVKTTHRLRNLILYSRKGQNVREMAYINQHKAVLRVSAGLVDIMSYQHHPGRYTRPVFSQLAIKCFAVFCYREMLQRRRFVPRRLSGVVWDIIKNRFGRTSVSGWITGKDRLGDVALDNAWKKLRRRHDNVYRDVDAAVSVMSDFLLSTTKHDSTIYATYTRFMQHVMNIDKVWDGKAPTYKNILARTTSIDAEQLLGTLLKCLETPSRIKMASVLCEKKNHVVLSVDNASKYDLDHMISETNAYTGSRPVSHTYVNRIQPRGSCVGAFLVSTKPIIECMSVLRYNRFVMDGAHGNYAYVAGYVKKFLESKSIHQQRTGLAIILHWFRDGPLNMSDDDVRQRARAVCALEVSANDGRVYNIGQSVVRVLVDHKYKGSLDLRLMRKYKDRNEHVARLYKAANEEKLEKMYMDQSVVATLARIIPKKASIVAFVTVPGDQIPVTFTSSYTLNHNGKRRGSSPSPSKRPRSSSVLLSIELHSKRDVTATMFHPDHFPVKTKQLIVCIDDHNKACYPIDAFPVPVPWQDDCTVHPRMKQMVLDLPDFEIKVTPSVLFNTEPSLPYDPANATITTAERLAAKAEINRATDKLVHDALDELVDWVKP